MQSTVSQPRLPAMQTDWKAAAWAGVIAGIVFVIAEMLLVWLVMGMSPWAPPRMMGAILLGKDVLPPPADFSLPAVAAAMAVHLPLSILYGLILGWIVHRLEMGAALLAGAAFGFVAVYLVNFYLIAPALFPWFVEARNWISIAAHVLFGMVAAGAYVVLRRRVAAQ
jgi:hypothetical protein